MTGRYNFRVSRRVTLQWLVTAAAAGVATTLPGCRPARPLVEPKGYGTDPNLNEPEVPWELILTETQLQLVAVLADLILPPVRGAPAPSALGVPHFVNEWVSAPYPVQEESRAVILAGLDWIDEEAKRRRGTTFLNAGKDVQANIVDEIARPATNPAERSPQHAFFFELRYLVVGAYYSTEEGFKEIGYLGNVALQQYPPPSPNEIAILDAELKKLGVL